MDNKFLLRRGMVNSGILAFTFGLQTAGYAQSGSPILTIIGLVAMILTINDTINFYKANKAEKEK